MKALKLAYKNVLRNKRRAITTTLLTAIGVAAMLIGGGFADFTYVSLKEMAARENGNLIMSTPEYLNKEEETPMQYGFAGYKKIAKQIRQFPEVRYAVAKIAFSGLISNGDKSTIFVGSGVDPKGEFKVKGPFLQVKKGRVLSRLDTLDNPQMLIGHLLAKSMKADVGSVLTLMSTTVDGGLNAIDVTVKGIVATGVPEVDKRMVLVSIDTAQELLQTDKVSTLSVYLRHIDQTNAMQKKLAKLLPQFRWQTWLDQAVFYQAVRNLYDRIFGVMGIIMLIIVFFAISNTVSMSVMERTREIGTLRALGAYRSEILRNFMLEGWVMGSFGALLGMILALLVSFTTLMLDIQMPPPPGRAEGYPLIINTPLDLYIMVSISIIVVCSLAAWGASRKAVKKTIVEALAHV